MTQQSEVYFLSVCEGLYCRNGGSVLQMHGSIYTLERFVKRREKVSIMKIKFYMGSIYSVIAWYFSVLVNCHLSDRTNDGDKQNRDGESLP